MNVNSQNVELVARKATTNDAGVYSATLRNNLGQDRVTIKVNVVDRPSAPQAPLTASNVTTDGCRLTWNPPKVTKDSFPLYLSLIYFN